jgi:hypothetical protein
VPGVRRADPHAPEADAAAAVGAPADGAAYLSCSGPPIFRWCARQESWRLGF